MSARISAIVVAILSTPALLSAQRQANWPDSAWRAIGPASFGGRVDDIEAVAEDPPIIFVGTASGGVDRKSTRLNSSHLVISYAVFCLKKKKDPRRLTPRPQDPAGTTS